MAMKNSKKFGSQEIPPNIFLKMVKYKEEIWFLLFAPGETPCILIYCKCDQLQM